MRPANLKIEYLKNPMGIDVVHPRLTWNDEGLIYQSAYQIDYKVNGTWKTTGKISSSHMNHIFEDEFKSRDSVELTLTVFDENDQASKSGSAFFEMGLLKSSDWKAKWISGNYKVDKNKRYPVDCFKKEFQAGNITKARLYISACGLYEASINGHKVSEDVFTPGSTDYNKRIQYQTYDVTDFIKEGNNTMNLLLADGWYRGSIGAKGRRNTFGKQTKLISQLELTDNKGNVNYINSDKSFNWSNDGPIRFADLKDGEIVDMNRVPSYMYTAIEVDAKGILKASNNIPVREHECFEPESITELSETKKVYKFPQNLSGYISLAVDAHKNDEIYIRLGEILDEHGEVTLKNVQCKHKGKLSPLQEIRIICKEGLNKYKSRFFFGGFAYAQVETSHRIENLKISSIAVYSDFETVGEFDCSNPFINTFVNNTLWSLKSNSIDVPTDCPTRERMGWTGDSQVFFNTASYLTDYASFTKKHLNDVFDRQWKDGRIPQIAPYSNEDWYMWVMNGSVGWADVAVLTPYRFYKRYGDIRILKDNFEEIKKYAHFMINRCGKWGGVYASYIPMSKKNRKYLVNKGQSYGEWAEPRDVKKFIWYDFAEPHPEESTAYTSWILSIVCEICRIVKDTGEIELFEEYSKGCKAVYQELISLPKYSIDTDRQAKLVRPLYMDLLDDREYAKRRLIKALDNYDWRLGTGFLSTPFILDVLTEIDPKYAYRLLLNEKMPGWLYMAIHNTGTIWEGWEGEQSQEGIASLNHYSKGAVVEWLYRGMAGIDVSKENEFIIRPIVNPAITHCKASYDSIYGTIGSEWKYQNNQYHFSITVPGNTSAVYIGPDGNKQKLNAGNYKFTFKGEDNE